jgi:hypothetical protein
LHRLGWTLREDKFQRIEKTCRLNESESNFLTIEARFSFHLDLWLRSPLSPLPRCQLGRPFTTHGCLHTVLASCTLDSGFVKSVGSEFFRTLVGAGFKCSGATKSQDERSHDLGVFVRTFPGVTGTWTVSPHGPPCPPRTATVLCPSARPGNGAAKIPARSASRVGSNGGNQGARPPW